MTNSFEIIENFYQQYSIGINNIAKLYSLPNEYANTSEIKGLLYKHCEMLLLQQPLHTINDDLFYYLNEYLKSKRQIQQPVYKSYTCPACTFLQKTSYLTGSKLLSCHTCSFELNKSNNIKLIDFYKKFAIHSVNGYRCCECDNFIPASIIKNEHVICPYLNCTFVGSVSNLKKMRHPAEIENKKETLTEPNSSQCTDKQIQLIRDIIEYQSNNLSFTKCNFTLQHKLLVYKAFNILLDKFPEQMKQYLLGSRTGGFQHKIFQTYIGLLEKALPISILKNKKVSIISNLLDDNLCLFDGISIFQSTVNNGIIKNNTQEFYVGGRKAHYAKPFYIGKLLDVIDISNNVSLSDNILEYSFSKIKIKNVPDSTLVRVSHLRIPPHYEMGGMVYVNRIRKNIVNQLKNNYEA